MTSYDRNDVSIQRQLVFFHQLVQTNNKEDIKAPYSWPYVCIYIYIHEVIPHKKWVIQQLLPCHNVKDLIAALSITLTKHTEVRWIHPSTRWRHQMCTFSALLALCVGNSPGTGEFPSQRPVTRIFDILFDLRLNNRWANRRDASDLRLHRPHHDVTNQTQFIPKLSKFMHDHNFTCPSRLLKSSASR